MKGSELGILHRERRAASTDNGFGPGRDDRKLRLGATTVVVSDPAACAQADEVCYHRGW